MSIGTVIFNEAISMRLKKLHEFMQHISILNCVQWSQFSSYIFENVLLCQIHLVQCVFCSHKMSPDIWPGPDSGQIHQLYHCIKYNVKLYIIRSNISWYTWPGADSGMIHHLYCSIKYIVKLCIIMIHYQWCQMLMSLWFINHWCTLIDI